MADEGITEEMVSEEEPTVQQEEQALLESEGFTVARDELPIAIEALLLAAGVSIPPLRIAEVCGVSEDDVRSALGELREDYQAHPRGFDLIEVAGEFQLRTKPELSPVVRRFQAGRPRRLSGAALETLAIIAYRQPVVKSDVEKIRGVDATPTIKTLLDRHLIRIVGHQATAGQPALYGTTDDFLKIFGLRSLDELPTLRDVRDFAVEPGESEERAQTEAAEEPATPSENAVA